jgi:hypothetical protein
MRYPVIADPPLSLGAAHDRDTDDSVTPVEVKDSGALGFVIQLITDLIRPLRARLPL